MSSEIKFSKSELILLCISIILFIAGVLFCWSSGTGIKELRPLYSFFEDVLTVNLGLGPLIVIAVVTEAQDGKFRNAMELLSILTIEILMTSILSIYMQESTLGWVLIFLSLLPQWIVLHLQYKKFK